MHAYSRAAWGVNLPARLVVGEGPACPRSRCRLAQTLAMYSHTVRFPVKGTEIFDASLGRYKDMPVTDVLQMVSRE